MDMATRNGIRTRWTDGFSGWSWDVLTGGTPPTAMVVTGLLVTLAWSIALRLGSQGGGAQWFIVPVLYAAVALGSRGAALTALLAALLGGPLLPADVATAAPQSLAEWLARAALFLALGQGAAALADRRRDLKRRLAPYEEVAQRRDREAAQVLELIREDRLVVHFQPIVELGTGRVVGMESLARFPHEREQDPERWFELAWAAGVGPDLEIAALTKAVDMGRRLPPAAYQAVNLSPEVLLSRRFQDLLATLPWNRLVVEVTEHLEIGDYRRLAGPIAEIRARGGRLAIDDVGAGFASLRHVLSLSPDIIKLDGSLSRGIDLSHPRAALARGLVACAEELGATVVAEGIETAEDARGLRQVGAHCAQGYLFGRPAALGRPRVVHVPEAAPSTGHLRRAKPA
jgi:EAL domain-containing protein (putative c-di-GMP-specific phosphodiesterase class I)